MNAYPRSAVFPIPGSAAGGVSKGKLEEELAQYFLLAGRAVTQVATFGTTAGATGRLLSTSNATKGKIILGESSDLVYDESKGRVGVGTTVLSQARFTVFGKTAAAGVTLGGNAELGLYFAGGEGGPANAEGTHLTAVGGNGGGINASTGAGGRAEGGTEKNTGGIGGSQVWEADGGGIAIGGSTAKKGLGGFGGALTMKAGVGGGAEGATELNEGNTGGNVELFAGEGGPAGSEGGPAGATNTAGNGGKAILEGGGAGKPFGGAIKNWGTGGEAILKGGNTNETGHGGNAVVQGGAVGGGAGKESTCGNVELVTGLVANPKAGIVLTGEGKIALYRGTVPVAQHAAIANPIEELKAVRNKLEEVIAALKAIGVTA